MAKRKKESVAPDPFATLYPNVAAWVQDGWVEIGRDDYSQSFVRVLDIGGTVWEGDRQYPTVHEAILALDAAIAEWLEESG
jgi:hypothetical protein